MKTIFCFEEILICCQFKLLEGKVGKEKLQFVHLYLNKHKI